MQRFSITLFHIAGIQLRMHLSFLILPLLALWVGYDAGGWEGSLFALILLLCAFTCVILHELGHCWAARCCGIRVPRITILPIGGMAEFECIPKRPLSEIFIAVAGPAVNVILIALLLLVTELPSDFTWQDDTLFEGLNGLYLFLLFTNSIMASFNLAPIFPMDGGRVLRAILATRLEYLQATKVAALIAKVLGAICLGIALWMSHWLLAALFGFILFVGEAEYRAVKRNEEQAAYWREYQRRLQEAKALEDNGDPQI